MQQLRTYPDKSFPTSLSWLRNSEIFTTWKSGDAGQGVGANVAFLAAPTPNPACSQARSQELSVGRDSNGQTTSWEYF